jgi:hypothetical protein
MEMDFFLTAGELRAWVKRAPKNEKVIYATGAYLPPNSSIGHQARILYEVGLVTLHVGRQLDGVLIFIAMRTGKVVLDGGGNRSAASKKEVLK